MSEIIKKVIKGASGYGPGDTAYNDKVTITPSSISYEYDPVMETEINPKRKWSYKTDSSIFKMKFETIAVLMPGVFERNRDEFCTDIGGIECVVTYSDRRRKSETFWGPGDYFCELFRVIKSLVPETEFTPEVLKTGDDFEEEEPE